jgi:uncharacterized protein (DUF433 family)
MTCRIHDDDVTFERISVDHGIVGGVPCVQRQAHPGRDGHRMVAEEMSTDEILAEFPHLTLTDIQDSSAPVLRRSTSVRTPATNRLKLHRRIARRA